MNPKNALKTVHQMEIVFLENVFVLLDSVELIAHKKLAAQIVKESV